MVASGQFIASEWRNSVDRFVADLWDMTNFQKAGRYVAPRDKSLGFSRDNIEYHFDGPARKIAAANSKKAAVKKATMMKAKAKSKAPNAAERRAAENADRLERRRKLAEQVLTWDRRSPRG